MEQATKVYRRDVIREVRERWLKQYCNYPDEQLCSWCNKTAGQIRADLRALDLDSCTAEDVDRAIGATGWAANRCDECDRDSDVLLRLGEQPGYENRWWDLCRDCLSEAANELAPSHSHS